MYNDKHVSNPIIITSYDNYPTISRNRTLLVLRHHLTCYQQTRGWLEHGRKVTLTLSLSFSIPLPLEILKGERSYTMSLACLALHNARVRVSRSQEGGGMFRTMRREIVRGRGWVAIICSAAILSISVPIRVCRSHVDKRSTLGLSTMNRLYLPTVGRFTLCYGGDAQPRVSMKLSHAPVLRVENKIAE